MNVSNPLLPNRLFQNLIVSKTAINQLEIGVSTFTVIDTSYAHQPQFLFLDLFCYFTAWWSGFTRKKHMGATFIIQHRELFNATLIRLLVALVTKAQVQRRLQFYLYIRDWDSILFGKVGIVVFFRKHCLLHYLIACFILLIPRKS